MSKTNDGDCLVGCIGGLLWLGFYGGILWVVCHFIAKYW